jgi:uncharacterized protein YdeI (YjbR/CyaY-like superfamily)
VVKADLKNHSSFNLYKAEVFNNRAIRNSAKACKRCSYVDKLKSIDELPAKKVLAAYIKEAMLINESGIKKTIAKSDKPKVVEMPDYFAKALKANAKANKVSNEKQIRAAKSIFFR